MANGKESRNEEKSSTKLRNLVPINCERRVVECTYTSEIPVKVTPRHEGGLVTEVMLSEGLHRTDGNQ